jgi:hypothetical protein
MNVARLSFGLVFLLGSAAHAEDQSPLAGHGHPLGNGGGMCGTHAPQIDPGTTSYRHVGAPSKVIFVDRCADGCLFTGDTAHDAKNDRVAIRGTTPGQTYQFGPFKNFAGQTGTAADAEWSSIVSCMRKVYSYYDTVVTDVRPTEGTYHRAVVSGLSTQLIQGDGGTGGTLLGISDVQCSGAIHNMTSFTFADSHRPFSGNAATYVKHLCFTVAHEAGHSFGLEHEFEFVDGTSACNDPMSYDTGECDPPIRFFRNKPAKCGGFELTSCSCSSVANSHAKLLGVFGLAPELPAVTPISEVVSPSANAQVSSMIVGSAGHDRGVERVDLIINGFKWAQVPGLAFIPGGGQPNPGQYVFPVPPRLPNSVLDIQLKVYDDLGNVTDSPVVTAIKGSACVDASTCATGQRCEEGRCFWDAPVGEVGDECTYGEYCLSGQCSNSTFVSDTAVCTQTCIVGTVDACPSGLECVAAGNSGICFTPTDSGCCSTSKGAPWGPLMLAGLVIGLIARRRKTTAIAR